MIEEKLVELLKNKKLHIATAESCTGGLIASTIINVSGSSAVLDVSFITYHENIKIKYLKVKRKTIEKYNVVSKEVAYEMALGLHKKTKAEVTISSTGVAGPSGGTKDIPVGTVCFGIYYNDKVYTYQKLFTGSRNEVRKSATNYILEECYKILSS